jgi:predicted nucleic acid-binding OB-fold protein
MKLAFKKFGIGFTEKDVPILLNIGTLEAVCNELGIEFWQITDSIKSNNIDFTIELLWQGYLTACKEKFKKPKYKKIQACIWYEHLSQSAQKEFTEIMTDLFGKISKTYVKKKVTKKAG